ncbi:MAG: hypothetical protein K1X86_03820 [Ignavibacteria bacterium]|nr:hypothetical protein [Ignavibacteria bacterium]
MKLLLTIILLASSLFAEEYKIEKFDASGELPSNLVFKIYQDSRGFLWFGTMYGLYRYDGVSCISYRYNPFDSASIGNDDVISIFEDSKGYLWFGTYLGGVSRYDAAASAFTRFTHKENTNSICDNTVWAICEDKNGAIWFATQNGICKYENNLFTAYNNSSAPKVNTFYCIAADNENNLWAGGLRGGLLKFNSERTKFDTYKRNDASADSINGNVIRGLYCDKKGNLWIGMIQRGICMIKSEDIKQNIFRFNKQMFDSTNENAAGNSSIYQICENRKGEILFSSSGKIYSYKPDNKKFAQITLSQNTNTKGENLAMVSDYSGCLWVSSYENCLFKITKKDERFLNLSVTNNGSEFRNVRALYYDSLAKKIFAGSSSGILEYDEHSRKVNKADFAGIDTQVNSICRDEKGNLYIGTENSLIKISSFGIEKKLIENTFVVKIITDGNSIIAGTSNGIYFINTASDDTIAYRNIPGDKNSLSENMVLSLYNDSENNVWAGTYTGLNKFNRDNKTFSHYTKELNDTASLSNNYVYSILQKDKDNLYIGTAGGLNILNLKSDKVYAAKENSISASVINSMVLIGEKLWMGTNRGLLQLDLKNSHAKNYTDYFESGVFNPGALLKTNSGDVLAGNKSGLVVFNPANINSDTIKPLISFGSIKIYDAKKNESLDLSRLDKLNLDYSQNNFEIDFALMDFNNPAGNQYEYKLEGADKEWILSGNKSSVFYSSLNPGKYELKIRGVNYDGVRSNDKSLMLTISPPFWRTFWFYLIAACAIFVLAFALYSYRLKKNIRLALELERAKEEEREKWREQASIDYHDELGHKLTRISMYSRRALKKMNGHADELGSDINNIIETSNSLRMSARDLIWSLNPSEDSLYDFITRINLFADELFDNSGMAYHKCKNISEWKNIEMKMEVKRQLLFILKEGMNNALKYSGANNVRLELFKQNDSLSLILTDDGTGFEYPSEYSGYGLLNMKKRSTKAGFGLQIESSFNKGTKIEVNSIPFFINVNKN